MPVGSPIALVAAAAAIDALMLVADLNGPVMLARIGLNIAGRIRISCAMCKANTFRAAHGLPALVRRGAF